MLVTLCQFSQDSRDHRALDVMADQVGQSCGGCRKGRVAPVTDPDECGTVRKLERLVDSTLGTVQICFAMVTRPWLFLYTPYMGNAHRKAGLAGRITLDAKWYIGNELVAYGCKPADYDPAAFQGIHARYILVIIDEAGGVPKSIFDAVDALATNIDARVVAVGNPDDPASHFATICKPGSGWHVETISAFDTPAYTGERVLEDLLPLLVSPEWVEERKLRWGVTSPIYQSKVLGELPDLSDDTLILPKWIAAAQKRTLPRTRRPLVAADIARFGETRP
jgi:hypothetical protein